MLIKIGNEIINTNQLIYAELKGDDGSTANDSDFQRLAHSRPLSMMVRTFRSWRISTRWPAHWTWSRDQSPCSP